MTTGREGAPVRAMALPLEDYALIGDCETAALVGRDGSIDWLCWPSFDSPACFASLLGTRDNGRWLLAPVDPNAKRSWRYRGHTLVLESRIETADGCAIVIEFMPRRIHDTHVVRLVRGVHGRVTFHTELIIRFDYGSVVPWIHRHHDGSLHAIAGPDRLVLRTPVALQPRGFSHAADFTVDAGETVDFVLTYEQSYHDIPTPIDPWKALEKTERIWLDWSKSFTGAGQWTEAVIRSLITLRALIFHPSGGIVAAPTTSLPEQPGGLRNWDYRFCWLRDATFTLLALMNAGYTSEAVKWRQWLIHTVAGRPSRVQILYGIRGERRVPEQVLPWLTGYGGAQPVRIGNAAAGQLQLDIFGEVMDALYHSRKLGLATDDDWMLQGKLLEYLETVWDGPDEGIWEVRGPRQHFTCSKVMAWVAFDRAVKSVEAFGLSGPIDHWRRLRAHIHDDVCTKGYDSSLGAFTQSYGSKTLDASLLLVPLVGFLPPDDARVRGTLDAVQKHLTVEEGLLRRYDTRTTADGLPAGEGAFFACSFWLVDNLVLMGRHEEALRLFERLLAKRTDLGLLAEEYQPEHKRLVGNFPQAFSHIALVNSAYNLARIEKPAEQRSGTKSCRAASAGGREP